MDCSRLRGQERAGIRNTQTFVTMIYMIGIPAGTVPIST